MPPDTPPTAGPAKRCRYDSYCGMYCGACSVLMVTEQGYAAAVAAEWDTPVDNVECHGCKSDTVARHCRRCKIKVCAQRRQVEFCIECPAYPCQLIDDFKHDGQPHHRVGIANLETIREEGSARWLAEQQRRWQCSECGQRFEFYQARCPNCGQPLRDSRVEAEELANRDHSQLPFLEI